MKVAFGGPDSRSFVCDGGVLAVLFVSFGQTWGPKNPVSSDTSKVAGRGHIDWLNGNNIAG